MIRSFYTSISGLVTLENKQNTILNNMANSNTTGFKKDSLITKSFSEVMISNKNSSNTNLRKKIGSISLGSKIDEVTTLFTQGTLKSTNNKTDMAINGRGFFVVKSDNNTFYTRDGNFLIDDSGYLKTTSGADVLGINIDSGLEEPIFIGDKEFDINSANTIIINGTEKYELKLVDFEDYNTLTKVGENYYTGDNPIENARIYVKQQYLEASNVNPLEEMTDMMTTMRNFETNQKIVQMLNETLGKAANEIGSIK